MFFQIRALPLQHRYHPEIRLPFVVTEYEHARFWSWEVASLKATGHRLQAIESGGCYLWFDMPLITLPYAVICRMALNRIEGLLTA